MNELQLLKASSHYTYNYRVHFGRGNKPLSASLLLHSTHFTQYSMNNYISIG